MSRSTVVVCGPSPHAVGGGPTHVRNLLASPLADEFELIHLETGSRGAESPSSEEAPLEKIRRLVSSPFSLARLLLRSRPAVVHLNTSMDRKGFWRELVYMLVCKVTGCRIVYQVHGGSLEELAGAWPMRAVVRVGLRLPDVVVLLASCEVPRYESLGSVGRIEVIRNAIDLDDHLPRSRRVHSGSVRRLVYLGRLVGTKGELESIEAVRILRQRRGLDDVQLAVAGSGPARAELERLVARYGLQDAVTFVGRKDGREKQDLLEGSDVLLLPTLREGLPYVILESMAAGTPVVTTRVGGIPDVVVDGVHGRFVEPRQPDQIVATLEELAAYPDRLRSMSRACVETAEREFGLDRLSRELSALYRELGAISLEGGRASRPGASSRSSS